MTWYAHATIHDHKTGKTYSRGDVVENAEELDGWDELVGGGALSEEEYDASVDEVGPPTTVQIDGVTYVQATDSMGVQER